MGRMVWGQEAEGPLCIISRAMVGALSVDMDQDRGSSFLKDTSLSNMAERLEELRGQGRQLLTLTFFLYANSVGQRHRRQSAVPLDLTAGKNINKNTGELSLQW